MFLPDTIDLGQSEKYILSIRIKPDGFMFSIHEPGVEKNYCLRETTFSPKDDLSSNIQRIFLELSFLTQEFKETNVIIVSDEYDLIPASYFNIQEKELLYDLTHTGKSEYLLSGFIDNQDIAILFNLNKNIVEFLSRSLWSARFFHHSNLLINVFENRKKATGSRSTMFLNFHEGMLDIICFEGSKLIHSLTYEHEPTESQIYFILKLWEQCNFDQREDYVYISGEADELIVMRLQKYIKNIELMNAPSEIYLWNEDAQKAPLDLLALSL